MNELTIISYIILSVSINSVAQIMWKKGANLSSNNIKSIIRMMMNKKVIIGLLLYALSAMIWIVVLSNAEVSYAYPLISLGYVTTTILSWLILKERISKKRIIGITIIIIGVIIVGASL